MSSEWRQGQLRDFALINAKTDQLNPESPFITMSAVPAWGQWAHPDTTKGTKGGVRAQGGDVLVARITPCLENGKIAKVPGSLGAVGGSTEFIVLRGGEAVLSDFLFLWASERTTHASAVNLMTGSTGRQRVSASDYGELPFLLPPLKDQQRIVDLIGAVDDAIETSAASTQLADVALQELQSQSPGGQQMKIGDVLVGIDNGVTTTSAEQGEGSLGQRLVKASAVLPARFIAQESKPVSDLKLPESTRVQCGDLLMTRINTPERVGHICIADDVPPNLFRPDLVWRLRVNEDVVRPDFFEHLLSSPTYRQIVSAAASGTSRSMQQISKGRFSEIHIEVPSLTEQEDYANRCSAARATSRAMERLAISLRFLRAELLTALLSGAHRIPEMYDELMGA